MPSQHHGSGLLQLILGPHTLGSARTTVDTPGFPRGMRVTRHQAIVIVRRVRDNPDPRDGVQDELVMALDALYDLDRNPVLFHSLLGV